MLFSLGHRYVGMLAPAALAQVVDTAAGRRCTAAAAASSGRYMVWGVPASAGQV